ncbi:MAG: CRISPR-associated helicase Cas3' [Bacteroidales bacterium]|nr:CRISPR-associated helicase Cas3' [Bacteroidales bacterium]MCF8337291.1 CRISPR-associated helicase Cas3' [Bacteroidales bacterium]
MKDVIESHPGKPLIQHLKEVGSIVRSIIEGKRIDFSLHLDDAYYDINKPVLDLAYITGAFHDIGKSTFYFQDYIEYPEDKHNDKKKSHALLSALFTYFISSKYLQDTNLPENIKQLLAIFTYSAVKRHHGKLGNLSDEVMLDAETRTLMTDQITNIPEKETIVIIDELLNGFSFSVKWQDFIFFVTNQEYDEIFEEFAFDFLDIDYLELRPDTKLTLFYLHQFLYSGLLFGDKNDVITNNKQNLISPSNILDAIKNYRNKKGFNNPSSPINKLKNQAFFESEIFLDKNFTKEKHIYSVTLPTGMGKTITAFNLADKLRKLAGLDYSKIIINIPFTSIIDQNFEVYSDILGTNNSNILLKHHHLAEPEYKLTESILDYNESKFLIETWHSDTIVTTFVQLLESIFSNDKTKLMKFSNIVNSVVLLDEIQTVPYELWETIRETFKVLGKKFNIYFILISATQPLIFTPDEDITELIPNYKQYFNFFNRTKLEIQHEPVDFEKYKDRLSSYIQNHPHEDILAIINTKRAARETFQYICEEINTTKKEIYFLSTLITPYERKHIIRLINKSSTKQKIIISTQLVEAGVDISVDTVFRQNAPLDAIIQAAGRANRYYKNSEASRVFVYDIKELQKATNKIYGNDLMIKTKNVLNKFDVVNEKEFIHLIEEYFVEVRKQSNQTNNKLLQAMQGLNFALVNFQLIENRESESVFVQLNESARSLWNEYVNIYSDENRTPWERKEAFSKIRADFYDYVINVPIPYGKDTINFDSEKQFNFYVSDLYCPSQNYQYSEKDYTKNIGYVSIENKTVIV